MIAPFVVGFVSGGLLMFVVTAMILAGGRYE